MSISMMGSRERMIRAIRFQHPDRVPMMHAYSEAGYFEHGELLRELWRRYPGDSGDPTGDPIPQPDPRCVDKDGRYHRIWTDARGVTYEQRIFGINPIRVRHPLDDLSNFRNYKLPRPPDHVGEEFERNLRAANKHKEQYYLLMGWISIWEFLQDLRSLNLLLVDIERDTAEINAIVDMVTEYQLGVVKYLLELGADGIQFGDDFGTQHNLMMNPKTWRRFFKPRYEQLMESIKKAGKDVFFHSCGYILPLIEDLAEIGINALWPQLGINDREEFSKKLLERRICLLGHLDRQLLMQRQPPPQPQEVDSAVKRMVDLYSHPDGGLIFYAEIDTGFTFENIRTAFQAFEKYGQVR